MIPQTVTHLVPGGRKTARRVLVVDDVPEIGELYRALFRRLPHVSVQATIEVRSERAIDRLRAESYDLVITDYRMPWYSGDAVTAVARETQPGVPILLMTGCAELPPADRQGVVAILAKPLDPRTLLPLLDALLDPRPPELAAGEPVAPAPESARRARPTRRNGGEAHVKYPSKDKAAHGEGCGDA